MEFSIENVLVTISSLGATLLVLYIIANFVFHAMVNDKIARVSGYEPKSVNVTLITLFIMFVGGSAIGYLLEIGNVYVALVTGIILAAFSLAIRKNKMPKFINATYFTQLIVYYFAPIVVGVISGGNLKVVIELYNSDAVVAAINIVCILFLLVSMILLAGRYWSEMFQSNKCVKIKGVDFEKEGILLAEKDDDIFFEIDGKIHRIKKEGIRSIVQL